MSLILAPVVAACGAYVPMISGRGLGHTGGTLDKLDSIPGYDTAPDLERLRAAVRAAGCAIIGQTEDLAPADRRLYAIRDVTATVESIAADRRLDPVQEARGRPRCAGHGRQGRLGRVPAIARGGARARASTLVEVANGAGLRCSALLTDMNQCLGRTAGNALEVREALDVLTGRRDRAHACARSRLALAAELLVLGGVAEERARAAAAAARALELGCGGGALRPHGGRARRAGGPARASRSVTCPKRRCATRCTSIERAPSRAIDARALGLAVVGLGGGRQRVDRPDRSRGRSRRGARHR